MKELPLTFFSELISKFNKGGNGLYNLLTFGMLLTMVLSLLFDKQSRKKMKN